MLGSRRGTALDRRARYYAWHGRTCKDERPLSGIFVLLFSERDSNRCSCSSDDNAAFVSMDLFSLQAVDLFDRINDPESAACAQTPAMTQT